MEFPTPSQKYPVVRPLVGQSVHVWDDKRTYLGIGSGTTGKCGGMISVGGNRIDSNWVVFWIPVEQSSESTTIDNHELTKSEIEAFEGLNESYKEMELRIAKTAPKCHFRPMILERGDGEMGYHNTWWECSVCGHTKDTDIG